jgi:hypothetical protein
MSTTDRSHRPMQRVTSWQASLLTKAKTPSSPKSVGPRYSPLSFLSRERETVSSFVRFSVTTPVCGLSIPRFVLSAILVVTVTSAHAFAYATEPPATEAPAVTLPDSPGALVYPPLASSSSLTDSASEGQTTDTTPTSNKKVALARVKFVSADQIAPKQEPHDKVLLGLRESVTPFTMIGWAFSAGWAQLIDGSPNYGTNGKAFSQRLGAAAALSASKEIFSDSVLAPILHQDPRYYQLGKTHKFINRAVYAGTRPIIGRTDSGKTIPSYSSLLGTGGAAALTLAYYPEKNTTTGQVFQTWATSLGGSALGYLVSEFGGEVIGWLHVGKTQ